MVNRGKGAAWQPPIRVAFPCVSVDNDHLHSDVDLIIILKESIYKSLEKKKSGEFFHKI